MQYEAQKRKLKQRLIKKTRTTLRSLTSYLQYRQFAHGIRPTDVFLVAYPKSGSTWLSVLISNVLGGKDALIHLANTTEYIPDINRLYGLRKGCTPGQRTVFQTLSDPRFFKLHSRYDSRLPNVIYILRDPRSVMVSLWNHAMLTHPGHHISLRSFLEEGSNRYGEWDAHVADWLLDHRHPNLLLVRYEDLHARTAEVLAEVLRFSGVPCDPDAIDTAVEAASFRNMRRLEEQFGWTKKEHEMLQQGEKQTLQRERRFVRKGRPDSWREELGNAERALIEQKYGEVMQRLAYGLVVALGD